MGLFSEIIMDALTTSLLDYVRKEKINALGNKVFYLLEKNGKVDLREVQNEFDAIIKTAANIKIDGAKSDNTPVVNRQTVQPRKMRTKQPEAEKPRRGRKPKAAANNESAVVRTKRKYTRRTPVS
ncbi:MAG: hypothetical protein LBH05_02920 [Deferribacteraceae bacterium]|jgi:hypothetical protein|nr:hypothetical protein [Deferribacteraceae bacterium]